MTDHTYPEARDSVFVGGPTSQPRKQLEQSLAEVSESEAWARVCEALDAIADERSRTTKLFRNLCLLLHLDQERATADDVIRLVGELSDRAQGAERAEEETSRIFCAWLRDRATQWVPSSGIFAAINDELATAALAGEPFDAHRHGELDDLLHEGEDL